MGWNPIQDLINRYNQLTEYRQRLERNINDANNDNSNLNTQDRNIHNQYNQTMSDYRRIESANTSQINQLQALFDLLNYKLKNLKPLNENDQIEVIAPVTGG